MMGHTNTHSSTPSKRIEEAPLKWYNNRNHDDSENESLVNSSFDFDMAGASTPLKMGKMPVGRGTGDISVSFLSPMKKLDNLHLESELDLDEGENHDELGNQTVVGESDTDDEYGPVYGEDYEESSSGATGGTPSESNGHGRQPPRYVNRRKRHLDSPLDIDMETPRQAQMTNTSVRGDMSICLNNSTNNTFKLSFSNSDSTPCPVQPRKKSKLKFKGSPSQQQTPSQTKLTKVKHLLNFENSIKTSVSQNPIMNKLSAMTNHDNDAWTHDDEEDEDDEDDYLPRDSLISSPQQTSTLNTTVNSNQNIQSTPISQSTPANSRPPTPSHSPQVPIMDEFGDSINGYKFVKPTRKPQHAYYNYQTPTNKILRSQELKTSYNRNEYDTHSAGNLNNGKYKIVGDLPMSSAGLMDEAEVDLHVGDKRINDPYLQAVSETNSDQERISIRNLYFQSFNSSDLSQLKLPLLTMFRANTMSTEEIVKLINDRQPISSFYEYIKSEDEDVLDLLKRERLRWHPDKWVSKLRLHLPKENLVINKQVIDSLSQSLNSIIENHKQ